MPSSVDLGKKLESVVSKLVKNGRYNSKSEVIREGVRLVEEREKRLAELDAALDRGIADADAGRVHSAEEVFDRLEKRYLDKAAPKQRRAGGARR
jgi:antitoxin ParD1/3/4